MNCGYGRSTVRIACTLLITGRSGVTIAMRSVSEHIGQAYDKLLLRRVQRRALVDHVQQRLNAQREIE